MHGYAFCQHINPGLHLAVHKVFGREACTCVSDLTNLIFNLNNGGKKMVCQGTALQQ